MFIFFFSLPNGQLESAFALAWGVRCGQIVCSALAFAPHPCPVLFRNKTLMGLWADRLAQAAGVAG
jgi:hypothetical protein